MIFKPIKSFDDAADYFSREDNDFYDKCRKTFSKSLLEATEKEAVKKAKEIQKRYELYFEAGKIFVENNKITNLDEAKNLPIPLKKEQTVESILEKAKRIGPDMHTVIQRMFDDAKVRDQPALDAMALISIAEDYSAETLENACSLALKDHRIPSYNDIHKYLGKKDRLIHDPSVKKTTGILRGADYYRNGGVQK